jgi:uncharacterized integral membrane protein
MTESQGQTRPVGEGVEAPSLWSRVKLSLGLLAAAALLLFLLQNLQDADVHFLWFDWSVRLVWALLASALFGGIVALAAWTLLRRREP